jgi:uncharacterized SAM-binding protein YcdF (DUF218 family)
VFWIKKTVGHLISPMYFGMGLLLIGLFLHTRKKFPKLSRGLICAGVLFPLLAFNAGISDLLNRRLEFQYPAMPVKLNAASPDLKFLAVLGGGHVENPELSSLTQLVDSSRSRLVEAVRLARLYPDAQLLVCGPLGDHHSRPHAAFLAESAIELGVEPNRILPLSTVRDTRGEMLEISGIVTDQPIGIITSAWHMPRSMTLAAEVNLNATACPADYRSGSAETHLGRWITFYPLAYETSTRALREYMGILWVRIRS